MFVTTVLTTIPVRSVSQGESFAIMNTPEIAYCWQEL